MRRALLVLLLLLGPTLAAAQTGRDYALDNDDWNGLGDLVSIAEGRGLTVESRASLRWSDIGEGDVLVLLYPTTRVDPVHLAAFLRGGGRALIGDDFGKADEALARLGILRRSARRRGGVHGHEGNPNLLIAPAVDDHPLARGVAELTTNHPSTFAVSPGPDVIFSASGRDEAVVVAGQLGDGLFVALSDPSVLINAMLAFDGNLAFAVNLLDFLTGAGRTEAAPRPARLLVITGDAELAGEPSAVAEEDHATLSANEILTELSHVLDELNDYLAPETTLRVTAWVAGLGVLLVGAVLLGRGRGKDPDAGFARVELDAQGPDRLLGELDRDDGEQSYAYPAALLRENAEPELEARVATEGARGPAGKALERVRGLPTRQQVIGQAAYVSRRTFIEAHAEVVAARRARA